MDKLKSPLVKSEYDKIDGFVTAYKQYLKPPNNPKDLNEFIGGNGIFLGMVEDLPLSEKTLAWLYLRKILLTSNVKQKSKNKERTRLNWKNIIAIANLIIIVAVISLAVYKCSTNESKPKGVSDAHYITKCQQIMISQIKHPSTLDHKVLSTVVSRAKNGNIVVLAPFTAKNSFGVEMEGKARCWFGQNGKQEVVIFQ